ncbi:unnamed protein product [Trifolium pratense]|uniref:Uncharacterized protein n=1 Tax=Trifolium pratense TaxID=57577 RepID=A0ACB0K4G9_TRIPR|nr:unnamed protein product [Trifolium pratense]
MAYNLKLFSITLLICIIFSPTETASRFSHYNCTNIETFSPNSNYKINLNTLLSTLSSKASDTINNGYYNTSISTIGGTEDTIYGLFMCIGYTHHCGNCVKNSAKTLTSMCDSKKEAIIWSDKCMVHYSDRSFFDTMEESPSWCVNDSLDYQGSLDGFNKMLSYLMVNLVKRVNKASPRHATKLVMKNSILFEDKIFNGHVQCIPDISNDNCMKCLKDGIDYLQTSCARGKIRGSVLYPSCIVRYDTYPYFAQPIGKRHKNGAQPHFIIFHILVPVMMFLVAVFLFVKCVFSALANYQARKAFMAKILTLFISNELIE